MLESTELLLQPQIDQSAGSSSRTAGLVTSWVIRDAVSGHALGGVRSQWRQAWWRRLLPPTLEVFETEDEALLCTIHRLWSLTLGWEVRDAEGRRVGLVHGTAVLNHLYQCLAHIEPLAAEAGSRYVSPEGAELGKVRRTPKVTSLAFAADSDIGPFARMLLLAAAIVS